MLGPESILKLVEAEATPSQGTARELRSGRVIPKSFWIAA